MNEMLQEIKDTLEKAREYLIPDEKRDINYSKSDELILELFDYEVIDWMIMKIEDQQATIDSLSMAHDISHQEIAKLENEVQRLRKLLRYDADFPSRLELSE